MKKNPTSQSGIFTPRALVAFAFCLAGVGLAMVGFAANPPSGVISSAANSPGDSSLIGKPADPLGDNAAAATASMSLAPTPPEKWAIATSPNGTIIGADYLYGVTCTSASDCWAVGTSDGQTLIEHWDGTTWSNVTSPNNGADPGNPQGGYLQGVTCTSASDCWAAGYYQQPFSQGPATLIAYWDGTQWSIVASPNNGTGSNQNYLYGVTCASVSDCWAVGNYFDTNLGQGTLIEHWDGTSWSIVASPNNTTGPYDNYLQGVTCASASECWAVGYTITSVTGGQLTLIEQWNGTSWSIVTSPSNGTSYNYLQGVTCASASDCWAVGSYPNGSGYAQTLIEQWDGTSWSIVTSPNTGTGTTANFLYGVTCASASDCWTVGSSIVGNAFRTLIEQWNGTSWSIVTSPNLGNQANQLLGMTCASESDCWAVGDYQNGNALTLIEQYTTSSVTITTSASPSAGGTASGGSTYVSGTSVTVSATANSGYVFTNWTQKGAVVSTSPSYTFTATSNSTLVAHFTQTYTVSVSTSPSAGGTASGGGTYAKGSSVTVTATLNTGYTFTNWTKSGSIVSHSASYTFTLNGNTTLVANFTTNPVTLSTSASPSIGGTTSGDGTYASGANVTAKATPTSGYTFTNWTDSGNIVSHSASYTFKLNANRTLVANFTTNPVIITTSASPTTGGTTSGGGTYASGASVTVKATANRGHTFTNWTQSGSVVSTSASYTFTATANAALTANFTP